MKKIPIILGLIALALTLAACSTSADDTAMTEAIANAYQNQDAAGAQQAAQAPEDVEETPEYEEAEADASAHLPDAFYTFGDHFTLWDLYEVTFGAEASFLTIDLAEHVPEHLHEGDSAIALEGEVLVIIPVTITNISDNHEPPHTILPGGSGNAFVGFDGTYIPRMRRDNLVLTILGMAGMQDFQHVVRNGQTVERYIPALYVGDGYYIFRTGTNFTFHGMDFEITEDTYFVFSITMP
ncbi:MAG: hypothetical protein FWD03_02270 [Defluviitaleaceae bacterium]|nr:hypothetical protein [Defluviitaleaceae bacterium]